MQQRSHKTRRHEAQRRTRGTVNDVQAMVLWSYVATQVTEVNDDGRSATRLAKHEQLMTEYYTLRRRKRK